MRWPREASGINWDCGGRCVRQRQGERAPPKLPLWDYQLEYSGGTQGRKGMGRFAINPQQQQRVTPTRERKKSWKGGRGKTSLMGFHSLVCIPLASLPPCLPYLPLSPFLQDKTSIDTNLSHFTFFSTAYSVN